MIKFTPTAATSYPLSTFSLNKKLTEVETIKFLGLQLNNRLTCKEHIGFLPHKLSTVGFLMRILSNVLNISSLKAVYYAYYHSLVKYIRQS